MNTIWHIFDKPEMKHKINNLDKNFGDDNRIDYVGSTFNVLESDLMFCKHGDGGWYYHGNEMDLTEIDFKGVVDVPSNQFLAQNFTDVNFIKDRTVPANRELFRHTGAYVFYIRDFKNDAKQGFDTADIIGIYYYAFKYGILESRKCFLQPVVVNDGRFEICNDYHNYPMRADNIMQYIDQAHKFEPVHGDVTPVQRLCVLADMNLKQFSDYFGIKYRTVQNWNAGISECPDWAIDLFEYKLLHEQRI